MKIMSDEEIRSQMRQKNINLKEYAKGKEFIPEFIQTSQIEKSISRLQDAIHSMEKLMSTSLPLVGNKSDISSMSEKIIFDIFKKTSKDQTFLAQKIEFVFKEILNEIIKATSIIQKHNDLKPRAPMTWKFKINRDSRGRIESIDAESENYNI